VIITSVAYSKDIRRDFTRCSYEWEELLKL